MNKLHHIQVTFHRTISSHLQLEFLFQGHQRLLPSSTRKEIEDLFLLGSLAVPVEVPVEVHWQFLWRFLWRFIGSSCGGSCGGSLAVPVEVLVEVPVEVPVEVAIGVYTIFSLSLLAFWSYLYGFWCDYAETLTSSTSYFEFNVFKVLRPNATWLRRSMNFKKAFTFLDFCSLLVGLQHRQQEGVTVHWLQGWQGSSEKL